MSATIKKVRHAAKEVVPLIKHLACECGKVSSDLQPPQKCQVALVAVWNPGTWKMETGVLRASWLGRLAKSGSSGVKSEALPQ